MGTPVRRCVACRRRAPKSALVRLVVADRAVTVDPTSAAPGRGAYLCGGRACTDAALRRGGAALRRALRASDTRVTVDLHRLRTAVATAAATAAPHDAWPQAARGESE